MTGLLICLRSAAKITHKAEASTSQAEKWHVVATIDYFSTDLETPSDDVACNHVFPVLGAENREESDEYEDSIEDELEGMKIVQPHVNTISFQKRLALGDLVLS